MISPPCPRSSMCRATRLQIRIAALRLRSSTCMPSASSTKTASLGSGFWPAAVVSPPALWIRMSLPVRGQHLLDDAVDIRGKGKITDHGEGGDAELRADLLRRGAQRAALAELGRPVLAAAVDRDGTAHRRHALREATTQAAPGARHQRYTAGQVFVPLPVGWWSLLGGHPGGYWRTVTPLHTATRGGYVHRGYVVANVVARRSLDRAARAR